MPIPCPRPTPGSLVAPPPDLFSDGGVLSLSFNYYTTVDSAGRTLFCFLTPDGLESPTLHLNPDDRLDLSVTNLNPPPPPGSPTEVVSNSQNQCGDATMTITSLNVHYHGTNTSPACHSDEVIHTIIDLQVQYDRVAQPLQVVALDGVPTGSQDGTRQGKLVTQSDILLAPAARAEFIVTGPTTKVKAAIFLHSRSIPARAETAIRCGRSPRS